MVAKSLDHHIRLNRDARSDIEWWFRFSAEWNGMAMIQGTREVEASLTSDASGQWGCGAFSGSEWFMLQWSSTYRECHITAKELVPIVIAASVWGRRWRGKTIKAWCDNSAVVCIVNQGSSRNQEAMHLARCLAFIKAKFDYTIVASHIQGAKNTSTLADALSRDNLALFRSLHPQANQNPTAIPEALLDLLIISKPDWTSKHWTDLWNANFPMV